jgi:hypothetical protein
VTICRRELLRAALGAILFGGGSGFVGIVISAFIGALTGMILGRAFSITTRAGVRKL